MIRYDSTIIRKCYFDPKLTLFALFSVFLTTVDLGSDTYQSYDYIINGNIFWGQTTITIVFVPFFTVLISESLRHFLKKEGDKNITWISKLKTIFKHFPFVQPLIHFLCLKDMKMAKDQMEKSLKFYESFNPDMITDKNKEFIQKDVERAANDYVKAKDNCLRIMTDFQKMKLYEAFGESAPQAALQISIVLQVGILSTTQIITICTSFLSLTLGASEILLMMSTKDNPIKESSWKATWLLGVFQLEFVSIIRVMNHMTC